MSNELTPQENEIIFYTTPDGVVHVEALFQHETFWLNQKKIGELFGVESHTITWEIYKSGELGSWQLLEKFG